MHIFPFIILLFGLFCIVLAQDHDLDRGWEYEPKCEKLTELDPAVLKYPYQISAVYQSAQFYRKNAFPNEPPMLLQGQQLKYNHATRESMRINALNSVAKQDHPSIGPLPVIKIQKWIYPLILDANGHGKRHQFTDSWYKVTWHYPSSLGWKPKTDYYRLQPDNTWLSGCVAVGDENAISFEYQFWVKRP